MVRSLRTCWPVRETRTTQQQRRGITNRSGLRNRAAFKVAEMENSAILLDLIDKEISVAKLKLVTGLNLNLKLKPIVTMV